MLIMWKILLLNLMSMAGKLHKQVHPKWVLLYLYM